MQHGSLSTFGGFDDLSLSFDKKSFQALHGEAEFKQCQAECADRKQNGHPRQTFRILDGNFDTNSCKGAVSFVCSKFQNVVFWH